MTSFYKETYELSVINKRKSLRSGVPATLPAVTKLKQD